MKLRQILDILFWVLLTIVVILLLWRIFGNSPTDLSIIMPALLMLLVKTWSISDNLKDFKHEVRFSFRKVREDTSKTKENISDIEHRLNKVENKLDRKRAR